MVLDAQLFDYLQRIHLKNETLLALARLNHSEWYFALICQNKSA